MKYRKFAVMAAGAYLCLAGFTAQAQTRILPMGDSVTSSFSPNNSYRYALWHRLVDRGYDVDFVGTQHVVAGGEPADPNFDQDHEGHPGWQTSDGVFAAEAIAAATQPDIVLLDLGGNDVQQGVDPAETLTNLTLIVEAFRSVNPNITVLMALPTGYIGENSRYLGRLRSNIRKLARRLNTRESKVLAVNIASGFKPSRHTDDGVHPNAAGESRIARVYYNALRRVLPRP